MATQAASGELYPLAVIVTSKTHVQVVWAESPDSYSIDPVWDGEDTNRRQQVIEATIDCLADVALRRGQDVYLHTASQIATRRMESRHPQLLHTTGRTGQVESLLAAAARSRQADVLSRYLMIGTDVSASPRKRGVAISWVDSAGRWGAYTLLDTNTVVGELHAIVRAAECAPPERDLLIITDCQPAMRMATGLGMSHTVDGSLLQERLRHLIGKRRILVRWVPGHTGVPINETAHRLALNELRRTSLKVRMSVSRRVAAQIVEEFLAQPSQPLPAGAESDQGLVPHTVRPGNCSTKAA